MGQCSKICEGTFWLEMADSTAIVVKIFSILMLDQFSQRRKMPLELAHLRNSNLGSKKPTWDQLLTVSPPLSMPHGIILRLLEV